MSKKVVLMVKFKSKLSPQEVMEIANKRIDEFRSLPGLEQKYYLHDPVSDAYSGFYIWESKEALDAFNTSELRASIPKAYQIDGQPRIEVFEVFETLR